jgi:hypothetical protein
VPTIHNVYSPVGIAELNGNIFSTSFYGNALYKIYVYLKDIGDRPYFIASDGIRYLYIASFGNGTIIKFDTTNDTFITSAAVFSGPRGIYLYQGILYVSTFGDSKIQTVRASDLTIINSNFIENPSGSHPLGIVVYDNNLYIAIEDINKVWKYNLSGVKDSNFSLTCSRPSGITMNNSYFFVSSQQSGNVYQFDLNGNLITPSPFTDTYSAFQMLFYNNSFFVASWQGDKICEYPVPIITNFIILAKEVGDSPFPIIPPSSTSSGAFSYKSSDESVATIVGDIITIVGAGTTIITATQASTIQFTSWEIRTTFQVIQVIKPPLQIASGNDLLTFMDTDPTIVYGNILEPVEIESDLLSANYKVLFANDPNVTITKI